MPSLELLNFSKSWPKLRLEASLTVESASMLAIVGHSGCGKSTLLRLIAGLIPSDGGTMLLDGIDVRLLSPAQRGIGMVFQDHALFPHLNVRKNVEYGLVSQGVGKKARAILASEMLDSMDLAGYEKRKVSELSGGERQRVALARTLAAKPRMVLFDEPLSSLDPGLRKRLRAEIRTVQQKSGLTAIYVTHDLEEALAIADAVAIMDGGRILQCAKPRELWENPANARAAAFLGNGVLLPVNRVERSVDGSFLMHTDAGVFTPGMSAGVPQPIDGTRPLAVYFSRCAGIVLEPDEPALGKKGTVLRTKCVHCDYAGDAVECRLESGASAFTMRFGTGSASGKIPEPGKACSIFIPGHAVRAIPQS